MSINEKRYDDSVKLALAMGEIDDALIEEARTPYPVFMTTKRLVTLAASLLVVIVISIAAIALAPVFAPADGNSSGEDAGGDAGNSSIYGIGDVVNRGDSSIVLIDKTDDKYTFLMTLSEKISSLDIYLYGYKVATPAEGNLLMQIVATTAATAPDGYVKLDMPKILVNGKESALPTEAGTYLITIDTSELKSEGCALHRFGITYFNAVFNYN